jgi:hypothetical protein
MGDLLSAMVSAVIIESVVIQSLEKPNMDVMLPMQAIDVLAFDLWVLSTPMQLSALEIIPLGTSVQLYMSFSVEEMQKG